MTISSKRFKSVSKIFRERTKKYMKMYKLLQILKNIKNINSNWIPLRTTTDTTKNKSNIKEDTIELPINEVRTFAKDCMIVAGACEGNAQIFSDVLVDADIRGFFGHGLARLDKYVNDVMEDLCDGNAQPTIKRENGATAWVDGNNGLGAVVGTFCTELAIKKAKEVGISLVASNNSNHFGTCSFYNNIIIQNGYLGMIYSNASPSMSPPGGKTALLGTNPISVAAPAMDGESFVLDASTSMVSLGKIEMSSIGNKPIPIGWALDTKGENTTSGEEALKSGIVLPLGSPCCGYKGFGIAMWAEIMTGILSDSKYGPEVSKWGKHTEPRDLGHSFLVIDPDRFASGFGERLCKLIKTVRATKRIDPKQPILVAGDMEKENKQKVEDAEVITYHKLLLKKSMVLSKKLNVKFPTAC